MNVDTIQAAVAVLDIAWTAFLYLGACLIAARALSIVTRTIFGGPWHRPERRR